MASLSHILAAEPASDARPPPNSQSHALPAIERPRPVGSTPRADRTTTQEQTPEHNAPNDVAPRRPNPPTSTPLNAPPPNVYTGNKMRHLKKEDGIPLWRKDIQYDFLRIVFYDQTRCFTKYSEKTSGFTFAEVYIDAMAKSSKCSKILKEKLLSDTDGAISMAMVCLLVNLGRMNTTLNFFPEMRAQLRTYHSIPALQAQQDPNAYKQLQDAPRLKSILKGATEDEPQPWTMEDIKAAAKPRTNAVNLIFVMSQFALKVSDTHFPPPRDFYDLIMRPSLSSESRARAFLWLLWWYLESNFTKEDALNNPFGPGQYHEGDEGTDTIPQLVPPLESLTEEQADMENVDTEQEKVFGEVKRKERIAILATDPSPAMVALKRARNQKGLGQGNKSDDEGSEAGWYRGGRHDHAQTRSPSPSGPGDMKIRSLLNDDGSGDDTPASRRRPGRGNWRSKPKDTPDTNKNIRILPNIAPDAVTRLQGDNGDSPNRHGGLDTSRRDHIPTPSYQAQKRHRGVTQHQSALNIHRRAQMDYMLDRSIRDIHITARRARQEEGALIRAWKRIRTLPADYDSDEEMIKARKARDRDKDEDAGKRGARDDDASADAGNRRSRTYLAGFAGISGEGDGDIGEEVKALASVFRKACRRLDRWQNEDAPGEAIVRRQRRAAELASRKEQRHDVDIDMDDISDDDQ